MVKNYRLFVYLNGETTESEIYGHDCSSEEDTKNYPIPGRWVIEDFPELHLQDSITQVRYMRALERQKGEF